MIRTTSKKKWRKETKPEKEEKYRKVFNSFYKIIMYLKNVHLVKYERNLKITGKMKRQGTKKKENNQNKKKKQK